MTDARSLLLEHAHVSLSDVQPYLVPTIVPDTIQPPSSPQQSITPAQGVASADTSVVTANQSNFDHCPAMIDFGDTDTSQCTSGVTDVARPTPSAPPATAEHVEDILSLSEEPLSPAQNQHTTEPKIPISHLIASNQYPSLRTAPPPNIVQSFSPVYIDSSKQTQLNATEELYSSYVNDPYNLTLHVEQNFGGSQVDDETADISVLQTVTDSVLNAPSAGPSEQQQVMPGASMNIFQSAAYFGAQSDATIPPGSEMLFGQP